MSSLKPENVDYYDEPFTSSVDEEQLKELSAVREDWDYDPILDFYFNDPFKLAIRDGNYDDVIAVAKEAARRKDFLSDGMGARRYLQFLSIASELKGDWMESRNVNSLL